eukprot:1153496-Prymnesium_polylepis.1
MVHLQNTHRAVRQPPVSRRDPLRQRLSPTPLTGARSASRTSISCAWHTAGLKRSPASPGGSGNGLPSAPAAPSALLTSRGVAAAHAAE